MSFYCTNQVLRWLQKAAAPLLLLVTAVVAAGASSSMFAPGGQLFAFIALVAIAYSTGLVVEHVFRGPALLGQMVVSRPKSICSFVFRTAIPLCRQGC